MVHSLLQTAPHVTTVFEADMSAVVAHRATHRGDFEARGAPLTFTAYFLSAAAAALRAVPEANSRWTDSALEIYDTINIGVATAIEDIGLVVPVLRAVESKDLFAIARDLNKLVTAARAGKLQPADVRGGTFTISNHGVSGSLLATPIVINQPQSAILGIGKLEKRVTVTDKDGSEHLIVRPQCYVTLTIDHRVMDGHRANQFLQTFVRTLESWPAQ
jgi:2-oxoglutarate dehydrogenase E2 component (dihydrolipoamide succinyltransferase)